MSFVPISNFVRVDWESDLYNLTGFTSFITRIGRCSGGLEVIAISRSFANPAARVHLRDAGYPTSLSLSCPHRNVARIDNVDKGEGGFIVADMVVRDADIACPRP